jgi:hypothetical protein
MKKNTILLIKLALVWFAFVFVIVLQVVENN